MSNTVPDACYWTLLPVAKFGDHASAWDALNDAGAASPVLTSDIFSIALRHFGTGDEQLAIARAGDRIVAMAVLQRRGSLHPQTFQPAQLPIGAWVQAPGMPLAAIAQRLARVLPWPALAVGVSQQDPLIVSRPADDSRSAIETADYIETSAVGVSGAFEAYWNDRGSNLKQNLRKLHNKVVREGLTARAEFITEATQVGAAVDRYGVLESSGWKGQEGTALHPANVQGRFYRELLGRYADTGEALVAEYHIGDALVCSDLCIARNGVLVILKTAHSESEARFSPATLLNFELFRHLFESSTCRRVEFYGRVMDWHRRWMSDSRVMYHVSAYRGRLIRRVVSAARARRASRRLGEAAPPQPGE